MSSIGGSGGVGGGGTGGVRGTHAPVSVQFINFVFMQLSVKIMPNNKLAPSGVGASVWETLDPPLLPCSLILTRPVLSLCLYPTFKLATNTRPRFDWKVSLKSVINMGDNIIEFFAVNPILSLRSGNFV